MTTKDINDQIDRLLHDAEHAKSGAIFAARIGHAKPAMEMQEKGRKLLAEAAKLFLDNPGATWPEDCEFPAPKRNG